MLVGGDTPVSIVHPFVAVVAGGFVLKGGEGAVASHWACGHIIVSLYAGKVPTALCLVIAGLWHVVVHFKVTARKVGYFAQEIRFGRLVVAHSHAPLALRSHVIHISVSVDVGELYTVLAECPAVGGA